jgi:ADP-ribose pyrophosphatase YjhB (NUDIX family)
MADNHEQAIALIDGFAFELLVLAYEFDYYFPTLLEHPELRQALEVTLPARAAAARVGLAQGTAGTPLRSFVDDQLRRARTTLEGALDVSEATEVFVNASDALYHWLRRYDCIDAEHVRTHAVVIRAEEELLLARHQEQWGLPSGPQRAGETLYEACLHALEEEAGVVLGEEDILGVCAQSYDYDEGSDRLYLSVYVRLRCAEATTAAPRSPARCQEVSFVNQEQLPAFAGEGEGVLAELLASGFEF